MAPIGGVSMAESPATIQHLELGDEFDFSVDFGADSEQAKKRCEGHKLSEAVLSGRFPFVSNPTAGVVRCRGLVCTARPEAFVSVLNIKRLSVEFSPPTPWLPFGARQLFGLAAEKKVSLYREQTLVALGSSSPAEASCIRKSLLEAETAYYLTLNFSLSAPRIGTVILSDQSNTDRLGFLYYHVLA